MIEYCRPTKEDAEYLAANLNEANHREMLAGYGENILQDLLNGMKRSDFVGCCRMNGKAVAIYGIRRPAVIASYGLVWLFMAEIEGKDRYYVARQTKRFVEAALESYSYLYNYVDVGNEKIIKWLKFLGADFFGPEEFGLYGNKHYRFEIRRK